MNLAGIDLNLLVALDALLEERHVTRAARRAGLTQPAMSNALGRLRRLLDDPVLVPGPKRMLVPSARAQALAGPLHRILGELGEALAPAPRFDPGASRNTFSVVTNDYLQAVLLPPLTRLLAAEAPGVDVTAYPPLRYTDWDRVLTGGADAARLPVGDTEMPRGRHRKPLFVDPLVCVVRARHPRVGKRLTLATYLGLPHLKVSPGGVGGPSTLDRALLERGLRRRVGLSVAYFNAAPPVVAQSDFVATIPSSLARLHAGPLGLRVLAPPLELPPVEHSLFWHDRAERAPEHRWLRGRILAAAALVAAGPPPFTS
ncbi:MAG TPA: LysR family transcriptional regulator [Polyangiaceae bacterium]|nr:LysR family transcriptional regulator [Polyangiaceae bacterium]